MQSFDAKRGIVECVIDRERSPDLRVEIAEYLIFHDLNEVPELPEEVTRCRAMPS